jgi:kinesin family member 18/19
MYLIIEDMFS